MRLRKLTDLIMLASQGEHEKPDAGRALANSSVKSEAITAMLFGGGL